MDEVERLIQVFSARGAMASTDSKLDMLMDLERLRDRGYRASNVVGRFHGTGLGLAGVHHIVTEAERSWSRAKLESAQWQPCAYHWRYPRDEKYPS
jgi:hypothetical protein